MSVSKEKSRLEIRLSIFISQWLIHWFTVKSRCFSGRMFPFLFIYLFWGAGVEPRALSMLGKHFSAKQYPQYGITEKHLVKWKISESCTFENTKNEVRFLFKVSDCKGEKTARNFIFTFQILT